MAREHSRLGLGNGIQAPVQTFRDLSRDSNARQVRSISLFNSPTFQCDFWEDFVGDHFVTAQGLGDIYDMRGIHRERGCLIVVRPDQYVANVLPLDAREELSAFFAGVLR